MGMLNVWRIPLLFYVSGMGVFFAIRKRNWKALLLERGKRILIPFVFGIVAIAPLHALILQKYYQMPLSYYPHTGHLWFLGNILIYVVVLTPLFFWLKKIPQGRFHRVLGKVMSNPIGFLGITLFFVAEAMVIKPGAFEMYVDTWHGFFLGLLAFLFGFLFVYCGRSFWETVKGWSWVYLTIALGLYVLRLMIFQLKAPDYLIAIESNLWIFGWLGVGYRFLNKKSRVLSYLSQAAYPIYIIHMFVLYLAAFIILPLPIAVESKFTLIVLFTGVSCFGIYEGAIQRVRVLRPLFGLKADRLKRY